MTWIYFQLFATPLNLLSNELMDQILRKLLLLESQKNAYREERSSDHQANVVSQEADPKAL